jgi:hypothetical protein
MKKKRIKTIISSIKTKENIKKLKIYLSKNESIKLSK